VHIITALLAAMEDLYEVEKYALLHAALGSELDMRRDNMLLLISFLYPSIVMLDTRANIDSKVSELRTFALEVLDNLLTGDIKQIVLPILDDLTVAERLENLFSKFPQDKLSPDERFDEIMETHFDNAFYWTKRGTSTPPSKISCSNCSRTYLLLILCHNSQYEVVP